MKSQQVEIMVDLLKPVLLEVRRVLVNEKEVSKSEVTGYVVVQLDDALRPSLGGTRVVFKRLVDGDCVEAQLSGRDNLEA